MHFLFALLLSLVPPYYRRPYVHKAGTHLVGAAIATGLAEIVLVSVLYARGFVEYIPKASIGPAASLEYFFSWQGFTLAFFFIDGAIRLLAAVADQSVGTMPLYLLAWLHQWRHRSAKKKDQCPLVADLVEPTGGDGLRISSCRTRKNWDKWMTVTVEEKLYEIAGAELAAPPRPYVYLLRPKPDSKVIRGLHRYHPDEVFHFEDD
jgi:hypothetical protein